MTSIIFGQPGSPVRGIAPACRGLVVPIFSDAGGNSLACSQLDLARAISIALDHGAEIINISGGQFVGECAADADLAAALAACEEQRVLVIAAATAATCRPVCRPCSPSAPWVATGVRSRQATGGRPTRRMG